MSDTTFTTFPQGKISALAMLYVEKHISTDLSPEDLLDMYENAYKRINAHARSKNDTKSSGWFN